MKLAQANKILFERYIPILEKHPFDAEIKECSSIHLVKMCRTAIHNILELPDDKISRWLGYIQGIMIMNKLLSIDEERNFSRELFHSVYENTGVNIPKSIDLKNN